MISHEYKVIFVHIPGTGGSFVERSILGVDMWNDPELRGEKHLTGINASLFYRDYWKSYFKFSIVRDPFARFMSMKRRFDDSVEKLIRRSGHPPIMSDVPIYPRPPVFKDLGGYYLNSIGEDMDFVACFETLQKDIDFVRSEIGFNKPIKVDPQVAIRSINRSRTELSMNEVAKLIALHGRDMEVFNYAF